MEGGQNSQVVTPTNRSARVSLPPHVPAAYRVLLKDRKQRLGPIIGQTLSKAEYGH